METRKGTLNLRSSPGKNYKILVACKNTLTMQVISDLSSYYSLNTNNQIHYGPVLENIVYFYARSMNNAISVGRIGKLECDFLIRNPDMNYSYVQVAYTILSSKETEDREYRSLELIRDNYPKYVMTTDYLLQHRNGIIHVNLLDLIKGETQF